MLARADTIALLRRRLPNLDEQLADQLADQLHRILLAALHAAGAIDWSRAVADAAHLRAKKGALGWGRPRSTTPARARSTI